MRAVGPNEALLQSRLQQSSELLIHGNMHPESLAYYRSLIGEDGLATLMRRYEHLRQVLISRLGNPHDAYVLDWLASQGTDIFTIAMPPCDIVTVELPCIETDADPVVIERMPIAEYRRRDSRMDVVMRVKLRVAESLMSGQ